MNKIILYVLIALLVVCVAGAGYYYMKIYRPLAAEYEMLKSTKPELDKAKKELSKYRERENKEKQATAWLTPAVDALKSGLAKEIAAGTAEVVLVDGRIVVNIAESVLFSPQSVTFGGKESLLSLANLAALLKEYKDKEILVGNMTQSVPAQKKGRKKLPAKDGRTIAAARSAELVKFLAKNGVPEESLIASAYPQNLPDLGFKLKNQKTISVISAPAAAAPEQAAAKPAAAKSAPATTPAATAAPNQQKPIPITTAPPKKVQ